MGVFNPFNQTSCRRTESLESVCGEIVVFNHFFHIIRVHQRHWHWKQNIELYKAVLQPHSSFFLTKHETKIGMCSFPTDE